MSKKEKAGPQVSLFCRAIWKNQEGWIEDIELLHCPLTPLIIVSSAVPSMNLSNIEKINYAKNRTQNSWVKSENATYVLFIRQMGWENHAVEHHDSCSEVVDWALSTLDISVSIFKNQALTFQLFEAPYRRRYLTVPVLELLNT